jgi:hypothetical protein
MIIFCFSFGDCFYDLAFIISESCLFSDLEVESAGEICDSKSIQLDFIVDLRLLPEEILVSGVAVSYADMLVEDDCRCRIFFLFNFFKGPG